MPLDKIKTKELLKDFNFHDLFIEQLGWNNHKRQTKINVKETNYVLEGIAEKCGMGVFRCAPQEHNRIPEYNIRKKIETQIAKTCFEHLLIFTDTVKQKQIWQWAKREKDKPVAIREEHFEIHQTGERLIQKLENLVFTLEEEEQIKISKVTSRVRGAFDVDKVTKKFYDYFKKEHDKFTNFIEGITEKVDKEWYASLMLNRLMFVYFIQKKGFLDNNVNYLKDKLMFIQTNKGKNKFYSFYRSFLLLLFHKGLGLPENNRTSEIKSLIGRIPYLNGGLFDIHSLEKKYPDINIPDEAFKKIFAFFDEYQWHLDDRPLRSDNEINPDVLGYIFEKYINQKEMGAYYTKEDITEYISKNTIIPFILDEAKKHCSIVFEPNSAVWKMLQNNPARYIYDAVKYGTDKPLPSEIEVGINNVAKRTEWNKPASTDYALPTEIYREVVSRRQRYQEVKQKIIKGEIREINDFITYNLNIRQFIQDVIENCEGPELLRAIYYTIAGRKPLKSNEKYKNGISILDPTCGSGAFLFAALNILEPLYEGCLNRMQIFVEEHPEKFDDFKHILKEIDIHPNLKYFVYKSIILNNLFGVDIMNEAVEIAKLRLFLKLVALVDVDYQKENMGLEALPDIDFNIRQGNTLVGFATLSEIEKSVEGMILDTDSKKEIENIKEKADIVSKVFFRFKDQQLVIDRKENSYKEAKEEYKKRLNELNNKLNNYLAKNYGVNLDNKNDYAKWFVSHQPFHWFVEFYEIIHNNGGFDIVIGNPPYVEYSKVKNDYTIKNYQTEECGNLYALIMERSERILNSKSRFGMIIPSSAVSTDGYISLQNILIKQGNVFVSSYSDQRGKLFDIPHPRLCVILYDKEKSNNIFTTQYLKLGIDEYRNSLFQRFQYINSTKVSELGRFPKIGSKIEFDILSKLRGKKKAVIFIQNISNYRVYFTRKISWYLQVLSFVPKLYDKNGYLREPSELKEICFDYVSFSKRYFCLLNSTLFYWFVTIGSDCRNLNTRETNNFFVDLDNTNLIPLEKIADKLTKSLDENSEMREMTFPKVGKLSIQCIFPKKSKYIIDEIDEVLAEHYRFTDEELDFIINYDIKYRMGKGSEESDDE